MSRDIDKKLRFLNGVYQKTLHLAAAWHRWDRKQPSNRVHRPRLRDAEGRVIGYGEVTPWKEPAICPIFSSKVTKTRTEWKGRDLGLVKVPYEDVEIGNLGLRVMDSARIARTPFPTAESVRPLPLSAEEIIVLYEQARQWVESRK